MTSSNPIRLFDAFITDEDCDYLINTYKDKVSQSLVIGNLPQPEDGGATSFFHYNQKITPKKSVAVWFRNINKEGKVIEESLHAGEEILTDTVKYALNIWTREHKY